MTNAASFHTSVWKCLIHAVLVFRQVKGILYNASTAAYSYCLATDVQTLARLARLADWVENCTGNELIRIAQKTGYCDGCFGEHILCVCSRLFFCESGFQ